MELRLHRVGGFLLVDLDAGQPGDHFLRRFGRHRLDLGARGLDLVADLLLGRFDLGVDLVGRLADLGLGLRARLPAWPPASSWQRRRGCVHARAPGRLGLVGLRHAPPGRASRSSAIFFSRSSTVDWIFGSIPRPMTKKMKPNTTASQNSCEKKIIGSWSI